jgi:Chaperone of endosialidase
MAQRKVWLGSTGPFLYDDEIFYIDPDYGPSTELQKAILTDGQITVGLPPTQSTHVVRKYELDTLTSTLGLGTMAYQNHSAVNIVGGSIANLSVLDANCVADAYAFTVSVDNDSAAFYTNRNAGGSRFGVYSVGTAPSYFNGSVTVNSSVNSQTFQVAADADGAAFYTNRNAGAARQAVYCQGTAPSNFNGQVVVNAEADAYIFIGHSDYDGPAFQTYRNAGGNRFAFCSNGTAPSYLAGALTVVGYGSFSGNAKVANSLGVGADPVAGFSLITGAQPIYIGGKMGFGVNPALESLDVSGHIYSRGHIGVRTRPAGNAGIFIAHDKTALNGIILLPTASNTGQPPILFLNTGSGGIGSIDTNATSTFYNTSSDIRLKESIVPLTNALDCIRSLNPISHKWKIDGSQGYGFAADELQKIRPECVTGEPDALNEDGTIKPQQIDYSKLVPWLVAAVKELAERN